jgi:cytochrome c2
MTCAGLLACALIATAAVSVSSRFFPVTSWTIDVAVGEQVFQRKCASCHSLVSGRSGFGPSLYHVGEWADTRIPGMDCEEYILTSIMTPGSYRAPGSTGIMPENIADDLSPDEILSVSAFLCSQGGPVRYRHLATLGKEILASAKTKETSISLDVNSVERGRDLFIGKLGCIQCHPLDPYPGHNLKAPSLLAAGNHSREHLAESILEPSKQIAQGYEQWQVVRKEKGSLVSGRRLPGPPDCIALLIVNESGNVEPRTFPVNDLEPFDNGEMTLRSEVSAMPSYKTALTHDELQSLLDFLLTLRE